MLFFGGKKTDPTPNITSTPNSGSPNSEYLGLIQFDLEEAGTVTHYEFYIDSVKQGSILVDNGQGGYDEEMFYVGPNIRSIGFRFFDSNGDENVFSVTQTIDGTTNSVSITHSGSVPFVAQTNTSVPSCNTADFEIDVISENEATFAADNLYNFYTYVIANDSRETHARIL